MNPNIIVENQTLEYAVIAPDGAKNGGGPAYGRVLSRHPSLDEADSWIDAEWLAFRASRHYSAGSYLPRIIIVAQAGEISVGRCNYAPFEVVS